MKAQYFFFPGALLSLVAGIIFSTNCYAHVKWFIQPETHHLTHSFSHEEIYASIALLIPGIIIAKLLNDHCLKQGGVLSSPVTASPLPFRIFQYLLALYLSGCTLSGIILVPHIHASMNIASTCAVAQAAVAIALLLKRFLHAAAILLWALFLIAGFIEHSFFAEYLLLAGIAWVLFTNHTVPSDFSITILRITLGISLIALALDEKLLQPELAFNVLSQYPLNFFSNLGINFSDSWFVLTAGTVELFIGLLLVLGLMVRTTTLVISGLMVASNSYFFCTGNYPLALMELSGHLSVFAIGVLLIFYYGRTNAPVFIARIYESK